MRQFFAILSIAAASPLEARNTFQSTLDPMTDALTSVATVNADGKISPMIRCDKNGAESVYLSFRANQYWGITKRKRRDIIVRFDGAEPYKVRAFYGTQSIVISDINLRKPSGTLLRDMMTAKNMVIQLTGYQGVPITDTFELSNAAEVIYATVKTCADTNLVSEPESPPEGILSEVVPAGEVPLQ